MTWGSEVIGFVAKPEVSGAVGALGLLLTIVGFGVTLVQLWRTRSAADAAARSARAVQEQVGRFDTIAACSSAVQALEEIERLHRDGPLHQLPDRYVSVLKVLIQIAGTTPAVTEAHLVELQSAISQLATLKTVVEKEARKGSTQLDAPRLNRITSRIIAALIGLLTDLRRDLSR
jgi:hypothetical protein